MAAAASGAQRLAEQLDGPLIHRAHLATFTDLSAAGALELDGPKESQWVVRLDRDADNLRSALTTAIAVDDADSALRIVVSLSDPGFRAIRYEVVDWAETVAAMDSAADHPLRPTAIAVVGYGAFVRGELDRAVNLADQAIELRSRHQVESCGLPERVLANALFYGLKRPRRYLLLWKAQQHCRKQPTQLAWRRPTRTLWRHYGFLKSPLSSLTP